MLFFPLLLAQMPPGTAAASAITSSRDMYNFWCVGDKVESPMCKHHALAGQLSKTTGTDERKKISEEIKKIFTAARSTTGSTPGSLNPFAKDYSAMKMAYCATSPPSAKILCSTAASRYAPSSPSMSTPSSTSKAMEWFCAKQNGAGGQQQNICQRTELLKKLREAPSPENRKDLTEKLKQYPAAPYGTMQAIYADFCKLKTSSELPLCLSLRRTAESKQMNKWYCSQASHVDSLWCKRTSLQDQLNKLMASSGVSPSDAQSEQRKSISSQLSTMMRPTGTGDSPSKKLSMEIAAAKKEYCGSHAELSYCKAPTSYRRTY